MATLYNKTALNKIKKAELVQLFLDQQAEKNQLVLGPGQRHEKMKADLKKLKEEHNEVLDDQIKLLEDKKELLQANKKLKEENEDLNRRFNDVNHVPFNSNYTDKAIDEFLGSIPKRFLKEENQNLKQKLQKIKDLHDAGLLDDPWEIDDNFGITLILVEDD